MNHIQLDPSQLDAVRFAAGNRFAIINGGAGCGKTTIIREICEAIQTKGENISLCAYAGKAAARLKEATGRPASTIHSMLGYNGAMFRAQPFPEKTVIVDESSMIDSCLLAEIVRRNPKRLILVGDQAQLPPVGAGQPFHDLIGQCPEHVRTLTRCYRNSEAVFKAASAIRHGEMPLLHDRSESEEWDVYDTGNAEETQKTILKWVEDGVFDFEQDIILTPKNGKEDEESGVVPVCSVNRLNEEIVRIVNPREEGDTRRIIPGDRVINSKNNPDKQIWNGTTGTVHAVDEDGGLWLRLDVPIQSAGLSTDMVHLDRDEQKNLSHAYALTVHKSQGSQYRNVCFVCLNRDRFNISRSLVYTAVTRTKRRCIVAGQVSALRQSLQVERSKRTVIQLLTENRG